MYYIGNWIFESMVVLLVFSDVVYYFVNCRQVKFQGLFVEICLFWCMGVDVDNVEDVDEWDICSCFSFSLGMYLIIRCLCLGQILVEGGIGCVSLELRVLFEIGVFFVFV